MLVSIHVNFFEEIYQTEGDLHLLFLPVLQVLKHHSQKLLQLQPYLG